MSRDELGAARVGDPIVVVLSELNDVSEDDLCSPRALDALALYVNDMIMSGLPSLIDQALSTQQLALLEPVDVQHVALALSEDLLRHAHRADALERDVAARFTAIRGRLGVAANEVQRGLEPFDLESPRAAWASGLADVLRISGPRLFVSHTSAVQRAIGATAR